MSVAKKARLRTTPSAIEMEPCNERNALRISRRGGTATVIQMAFYLEDRGSKPETGGEPVGHGRVSRSVGGIGAVTIVRHRWISDGEDLGYVNSDLIFLAGTPIVVLVWEKRSFGDYPAVTVSLDPKYLHEIDWSEANYLYEASIEDPRGVRLEPNIGVNQLQMVGQLSEPMPNDVQEAFLEAIRLFNDWKFGGSEPLVGFRKLRQISISGVCELVLGYRNEPLPANLHDVLRNLIDETSTNLKAELDEDPSYASGAQCLLKMIDGYRRELSAA